MRVTAQLLKHGVNGLADTGYSGSNHGFRAIQEDVDGETSHGREDDQLVAYQRRTKLQAFLKGQKMSWNTPPTTKSTNLMRGTQILKTGRTIF